MQTKIIKITANDEAAIVEAAEIIKSGGVIAFPTETVYGLGANAFDDEACRKIYHVKGRPLDKPLSLMVANREMIYQIAEVSPLAESLINEFLPGPLTLILPKNAVVSDFVTAGEQTVGIRMPDNEIALALIRAANCPIAAPSANLSGQQPPTIAQEVYNAFKGKIPLILDGGPCQFGISSTIVDLTGSVPRILREGAISLNDLEAFLSMKNSKKAITGQIITP